MVLDALGGPRVYDDVPRGTRHPYVTFGQTTVRDWSTSEAGGEEHVITLHVWSEDSGRREVQEIIAALRDVLHDRPLLLASYRLINLRHEFSDTRRSPDGKSFQGIVRFRAVTEPVS